VRCNCPHDRAVVGAVFDEANLVSCAGLAPVLALAEQAGLSELLVERLTVPSPNAPVKVTAVVAGMVAGADSIDDMDLLRHGAMGRLFSGVRAPSTLGTFLRAFAFGHVRQLDAVAARLLAALAARTPLLPGADAVAYVDIDDTVRETHGYAKQGAGFGYSGVNDLNALLGVVSTPTAAPVIAAARLGKGSTNSARGRRPPGQRRVEDRQDRRRRPHDRVDGDRQDGQRVLRLRRARRCTPGRGQVLRHGQNEPDGARRDRRHR
jgi:hypothetical protein